jgi:hypothetical protein
MLGRSGRVSLTLQTFARSKADLAVIVTYDVLGAVIAVLTLVLLGISKPSPLVSYFHTDPVLAWAVLGVFGPAFAIAVLDRIPVVRLSNLSAADAEALSTQAKREIRAAVTDGVALRTKSVERIFKCHYEDVQVVEEIERLRLHQRAMALMQRRLLHFDDVARQIERYVREHRDGKMPVEVAQLLEKRKTWPTKEDVFSGGLSLVGISLDVGLRRPVNVACRVAESVGSQDAPGTA